MCLAVSFRELAYKFWQEIITSIFWSLQILFQFFLTIKERTDINLPRFLLR